MLRYAEPGFSVKAGSTFHAYIKDFYCPTTSQMNMIASTLLQINNQGNTNKKSDNELPVRKSSFDGEVFKTDEISILPNPSHGEFEVSIDRTYMQNAKIQIFNMMGSMVYNDNIYIGQKKIVSINKQPAGIYLLKVTDDGGQITTKKIIKKTTIK